MRRLVLAIAVLAACGDDGGAPIPITELEEASITAYCNKFVTCGLVDDLATCRSLDLNITVDPSLVAAVQAGTISYRADKARECLDALTKTCERIAFHGTSPGACGEIFAGTVPAGGTCALEQECVSTECALQGCQGTCIGNTAPPKRPRLGESCVSGATCVDSFCDPATTACTAFRTDGSGCTGAYQCVNNACIDAKCGAVPKTGEACDRSSSSLCREVGDTCSATSNTCVALGLTGDACTMDQDCAPLYSCGADARCRLRAREGEPCDGQDVTSCVDHSWCDPATQLCTAPKADGLACTADKECESRLCDGSTGQCVPIPICI